MKSKIFEIISVAKVKGSLSWYFDLLIVLLISLNVLAIVLESVDSIKDKFNAFFYYFEIVSVIIFSVEYLLRIWTANFIKGFEKEITGKIRYALTPMALVDLFAVLPFYLPFIGIDLRFIRMLRLFRVFRLFKLARYNKALNIMITVFREKSEELVMSLFFTIMLLLFTSTLMYYVENDVQPEAFSSIPETMWWGIATLTTVGYGDVYPITSLGKILGGTIAILGIGLFALPASILASGFVENLKENNLDNKCPHCGKELY